MKSQIALVGIGLVIAAGVAYAELKPAEVISPNVQPSKSPETVISKAPSDLATPSKSATPTKSKAPIGNPVPMPTISGGGDDDDDERNEREDDGNHDEDDD
ncbi:MAG: hypothetical protein HQ476_04195 [SAR202 cluster bacterium]|jgi:hypothetical protein|nr:hypothetical protein [SAR202 cluster bacterium]